MAEAKSSETFWRCFCSRSRRHLAWKFPVHSRHEILGTDPFSVEGFKSFPRRGTEKSVASELGDAVGVATSGDRIEGTCRFGHPLVAVVSRRLSATRES